MDADAALPPSRPVAEQPGATRRATINVDLGVLKAAVEARSAAAGVKPSAWIRDAIQARLEAADGPSEAAGDAPIGVPGKVYRPDLDSRAVAKLDELRMSSGRRTRLGVLKALIDGVDLGVAKGAAAPGVRNLSDAVQELIQSNHQLVAVGRNLNQVAKSLNLYPGRATTADRLVIERAVEVVGQHLEVASKLLAEVRPQVRLKGETSEPRKGRRGASAGQAVAEPGVTV
ncbi:MAG TPA: hypothetical protein VLJ86_00700 [Ramlibacter sp.]|nr:hypothetical protein [Ramlibacter sp.]